MQIMAFALGTAIAAVVLFVWLVLKVLLGGNAKFFPSLKGKHVVITGGSSGIGLAVARRCISEGAFVTLMARNEANLQDAKNILVDLAGGDVDRILIKSLDVGDATSVTLAIQECFQWRPIDILICNAGVVKSGMFDEMSIEDLDMVSRINFMGCVYPVHAAVPLMKKRSLHNPSSIVFMSSQSAMMFLYGMNLYTSTKYALRGLAELLRMELMPHNIRVSVVFPGFTETPLLDEVDKFASTSKVLKKVNMYDREHAHTPEEVAVATVEGMKKGEFVITTGWVGFYLGVLGRGTLPAESMGRGIAELVVLVPMRIFTYGLFFYMRGVVEKEAPPPESSSFKHNSQN